MYHYNKERRYIMSFKAPKVEQVVQETPDPLINLGATSADMKNQRNRRGLLSTFLQGSRNRTAGILGNAINSNGRSTLGTSNI